MNRTTSLHRFDTEEFDICVIGAGASGAGVALDAALRGWRVALVEKNDFAAETSSRSTKLIHGGVRYLEQAFKKLDFSQLRQVKHGLQERQYVLQNAPHLARPLGIITPVFSWIEGLYYRIGLELYSWFAQNDTLPKAEWLSKSTTFQRLPSLHPSVHSGVLYYDGQLDDARYALALVQSASEAGAAVANYAEVVDFDRDSSGQLKSVQIIDLTKADKPTHRIKAKLFINCTGPFADSIRLLANPAEQPRIRPSKGVHLVMPKRFFPSTEALLIPKTSDGRLIFVIPFGQQVMVGTTDTPYSNVNTEPILEAKEVAYLLETMRPFLVKTPEKHEILGGFGGLRPLISAKGSNRKDTKSLLRDHAIEHDTTSGLLSLLGGKWTTYRLMAQDMVDAAARLLDRSEECTTKHHILAGGEDYTTTLAEQLSSQWQGTTEQTQHLCRNYGSRSSRLLQLIKEKPSLAMPLHPDYPFVQAEVIYAVREEMAQTPRDFLARRVRLELLDWEATLAALPQVATLMAAELGWTLAETEAQIQRYQSMVQGFRQNAFH